MKLYLILANIYASSQNETLGSPDLDLNLGPGQVIDIVDQPLHRRHQSAALVVLDGSDRVNGPVALQALQGQFFAEVLHAHGGHVALVGDDQYYCLPHVGVGKDAGQLARCQFDAFAVGTIDYVDQCSGLVEVVGPEIAQFLLPSHVPYHEFYGLVVEFLDVEANGGDGTDDFAQFERVEHGGFTSAIQSKHDYFALLFRHLLSEKSFDYVSHVRYYKNPLQSHSVGCFESNPHLRHQLKRKIQYLISIIPLFLPAIKGHYCKCLSLHDH